MDLKLSKCNKCAGTGVIDCECSSHPCPGTVSCDQCDGRGKTLGKNDREIKEYIKELLKYK